MLQTDSRQVIEVAKVLTAAENKLAKLFGPNVRIKLDVAFITEKPLIASEKYAMSKLIVKKVAEYYQLDAELLKKETRIKNVVEARSICYLLLKHFCGNRFTLNEIARIFNQESHSTIVNGLRNAESYYTLYDFYKEKVDNIMEIINNEK